MDGADGRIGPNSDGSDRFDRIRARRNLAGGGGGIQGFGPLMSVEVLEETQKSEST